MYKLKIKCDKCGKTSKFVLFTERLINEDFFVWCSDCLDKNEKDERKKIEVAA